MTLNFTVLLTVQGGGCERGAPKKEGGSQGRDDPLYRERHPGAS